MKAPTHIKQANQSVHIVPLSQQAISILRELQPFTGRYRFVFPGARGASKPLSENGVRTALRTMGYDNGTMTPHGFRGMASSLLNELGWNPDAIATKKPVIAPSDLKARELNDRLNGFPVWLNFQPLAIGVEKEVYRPVNDEHFPCASIWMVRQRVKLTATSNS